MLSFLFAEDSSAFWAEDWSVFGQSFCFIIDVHFQNCWDIYKYAPIHWHKQLVRMPSFLFCWRFKCFLCRRLISAWSIRSSRMQRGNFTKVINKQRMVSIFLAILLLLICILLFPRSGFSKIFVFVSCISFICFFGSVALVPNMNVCGQRQQKSNVSCKSSIFQTSRRPGLKSCGASPIHPLYKSRLADTGVKIGSTTIDF